MAPSNTKRADSLWTSTQMSIPDLLALFTMKHGLASHSVWSPISTLCVLTKSSQHTLAIAIKISKDELHQLGEDSIEFADGSGYVAELAVYHELHCIVSPLFQHRSYILSLLFANASILRNASVVTDISIITTPT
jgi:hypothetical protein